MKTTYDQLSENIRNGIYQSLGTGSGRKVYDLKNGYVVKVARNDKGYAQNEAEYRIWSVSDSPLLCKINSVSRDYKYLIMEKAEKIRHISTVMEYYNASSIKALMHMGEIRAIIERHNLLPADFARVVNWGMVGDRPVIIDYGFTGSIRELYY